MYIRALKINNFRSLYELWFLPNQEVNVLVGPNNSGKTTILTAIKLLFDPTIRLQRDDAISVFDFHNGNINEPIEITAWVHLGENPNNDIILRFADKVSCWKHKGEIIETVIIEPGEDPPDKTEELLAVKLIADWNQELEIAETEVIIIDEMINKKGVFTYQDREAINFRYYGTNRNPAFELSLARQSLFSKALKEKEVIRELRNLMGILETNKSSLVELDSVKNALNNLEGFMSPELVGGFDSFTLTFLDANIARFKTATSVGLKKKSETQENIIPFSLLGDGAQNLMLLTQISAALSEEDSSLIVAIEEPEQNLEPSLAKWFFNEITTKNAKRTGQVFITTHSPAFIGELHGANPICRVSRNTSRSRQSTQVRVGSTLEPVYRKALEQYRDLYAGALLAQHALIVEGASEEGFLPIVFNALGKKPVNNPFFLGLTIVNAGGNEKVWRHARNLRALGITTLALLDYDVPKKEVEDPDAHKKVDLYELSKKSAEHVICMPKKSLLSFCTGCDMEVMLLYYVPVDILYQAIIRCYQDAGHELNNDSWKDFVKKNIEKPFQELLPVNFPSNLAEFSLGDIKCQDNSICQEDLQKAFLYAALHQPHSCKSQKDMRIIAETMVQNKVFPAPITSLYNRIVKVMTGQVTPGGDIFELTDKD